MLTTVGHGGKNTIMMIFSLKRLWTDSSCEASGSRHDHRGLRSADLAQDAMELMVGSRREEVLDGRLVKPSYIPDIGAYANCRRNRTHR